MANLNILSGYRHAKSMDSGITYFVARNANSGGNTYYWRSLNNESIDSTERYPASAWSDWAEINTPIMAMNDEVRPVIYNNRLYISWVEQQTTSDAVDANNKPIPNVTHTLKFSYLKIDGTWAPAMGYPLTIPASITSIYNMYLTYHDKDNSLLVMLYDPTKSRSYYDGNPVDGVVCGGSIDTGMQFTSIDAGDWPALYTLFSNNLNYPGESNKIIAYLTYLDYTATYSFGDAIGSDSTERYTVTGTDEPDVHIDTSVIPPQLNYQLKTVIKGKNAFILTQGETSQESAYIDGDVNVTKTIVNNKLKSIQFKFDIAIPPTQENTVYGYRLVVSVFSPTLDGDITDQIYQVGTLDEITYVKDVTVTDTYLLPSSDESYDYTIYFNIYRADAHAESAATYTLKINGDYKYSQWNGICDTILTDGSHTITRNLSIPLSAEKHTTVTSFQVRNEKGVLVYEIPFTMTTNVSNSVSTNPPDNALIVQSVNGVCFLQFTNKTRRTRLNTLFAAELVSRASKGLDNVLCWDSQQLTEPPLGAGSYIDVILNKYDPAVHGKGQFAVYLVGVVGWRSLSIAATGVLSADNETTVKIFAPHSEFYEDNTDHASEKNSVFIGVTMDGDINDIGTWQNMDRYNWNGGSYEPDINKQDLLYGSSSVSNEQAEPMDFSGANGLYFWELFYYTPMLVADRLLQTQSLEMAEHWLKYIFNPSGYVEGSAPDLYFSNRQWNVRPLEEDTAWDATQMDVTDPDMVAQADPMHYKVATYMKLLDIMIARGDMAYRQLERDTLSEAKMWYVTARNLLGQDDDTPIYGNWADPSLAEAASETVQSLSLARMAMMNTVLTEDTRTANSLTALFLPCENEKLAAYSQTLKQRLYNLRHNLSISGQPLMLPVYAEADDPKMLQVAGAISNASGSLELAGATIAIQRFSVMLESAKNLVAQLMQFGSALSIALERKDNEALAVLIQTQGYDLMQSSIRIQGLTISQLQAEQQVLTESLSEATARRDSYQALINEGVSALEQKAINDQVDSIATATATSALWAAGGGADLLPNVFGLAVGGAKWGALLQAAAMSSSSMSEAKTTSAAARSVSEEYRRRSQEWSIQYESAVYDVARVSAQQTSLSIQLNAAMLQKEYQETQQQQIQSQLDFFRSKFSNETLYSWMQGRLSTVFYQHYDLTLARCLKAQLGYQWETRDQSTFIQPGAWDNNSLGLLCGEVLMLNLTQMESAWFDWNKRMLEVNRTVSMGVEMESDLSGQSFNDAVNSVLDSTSGTVGATHSLTLSSDGQFVATLNLSALNMTSDYPGSLGSVRRIRQVSVSLPALLGPYQDIQAVLSYSGSREGIHQSCCQAAISYGLNDSGMFQLDFNDGRYLPFEGLPIAGEDEESSLTLSFPNAQGKQHNILKSLNDIVMHIRYTINN